MSWTPSSPAVESTADAPACGGGETALTEQTEQPSSQLRRRGAAAGDSSSEAPSASAPPRRAASSPARSRRTPTSQTPPSSPPRAAENATRRKKPPQSPQVPSSEKRKAFAIEGESAVTATRKRRVAFSGLMTSDSPHFEPGQCPADLPPISRRSRDDLRGARLIPSAPRARPACSASHRTSPHPHPDLTPILTFHPPLTLTRTLTPILTSQPTLTLTQPLTSHRHLSAQHPRGYRRLPHLPQGAHRPL